MPRSIATRSGWIAAGFAAMLGFAPISALAQEQGAKIAPLLAKDLAGIDGKEGVMLTVEYAPGASSMRHRHNAHTFVYVLEGSVVMQQVYDSIVCIRRSLRQCVRRPLEFLFSWQRLPLPTWPRRLGPRSAKPE